MGYRNGTLVEASGNRQVGIPTMLARLAIIPAVLLEAVGAFANDSTAHLGAGGIELIKNDHISMREEVLEISPDKVRVRYRFFNESDTDLHTMVAFPLPLYDVLSSYNVPGLDPTVILKSFKVRLDGQEVATQCDRKALLNGRNVTDELRKLGLPDKEIFLDVTYQDDPTMFEKFVTLSDKLGGWWNISQTVFWNMTFPAKKETIVEHEYTPAAGHGWTQSSLSESGKALKYPLWGSFTGKNDERENEDCLDEKTKRAVENRVKIALTKQESVGVNYTSVEYILGTGRNWKGPIGEFRLKLVKAKPEQFVSVCFPGQPEKISPTVYEFYQKDYVPQDRLVVYFYTVDSE